ncbi:hypothetical protein F0L74_03485 [Chitinophaga agrisoli]|uniref:Uncharacterized protein n=1 Tax=Chitinophaga agrisoli TaxID=2607653 RepID=A0A5B2W0Z8_9BACT|nr:hypothetical protein [Chitinophaga agrisoli]KAA2245035.1 hypothetical protein F0L74_03485 [Chitinophaga agrisoli]
MQKVKVTNSDTLEQEIARLRRRSRDLEMELGTKVDFFKENYKGMAINSVIPGGGSGKGFFKVASHIAGIAWGSRNVKSFATSALMTAVEFIGVRMGINLFSKYQQGRRKRRARKRREKETTEEG